MTEVTNSKMNSLGPYVAKVQDESLRSYFSKDSFSLATFNLEKIKAQKGQIIEDAFLMFRTNLAVVEPGAKKQFVSLVEEIAGLEKVQSHIMINPGNNLGGANYIRRYPKTLLTPNAYNVATSLPGNRIDTDALAADIAQRR